jgi:hypothetical protein
MQGSSNPQTSSVRKLKKIPSSPDKHVINTQTNPSLKVITPQSPQNQPMTMVVTAPYSPKQSSTIQYYESTIP